MRVRLKISDKLRVYAKRYIFSFFFFFLHLFRRHPTESGYSSGPRQLRLLHILMLPHMLSKNENVLIDASEPPKQMR